MRVRAAQMGDVDAIRELWKEFFDFHGKNDSFFTRSDDGHEHFGRFFQSCIDKDNYRVIVATADGQVVGYGIAVINQRPPVYKNRRYGYVQDIAVTADYRRRGLGEQMYMDMTDWFDKEGVDCVELYVAASNEVSQLFWGKMGFQALMKRLRKDI